MPIDPQSTMRNPGPVVMDWRRPRRTSRTSIAVCSPSRLGSAMAESPQGISSRRETPPVCRRPAAARRGPRLRRLEASSSSHPADSSSRGIFFLRIRLLSGPARGQATPAPSQRVAQPPSCEECSSCRSVAPPPCERSSNTRHRLAINIDRRNRPQHQVQLGGVVCAQLERKAINPLSLRHNLDSHQPMCAHLMAYHFSCRRIHLLDLDLMRKVPRQMTWRGTFGWRGRHGYRALPTYRSNQSRLRSMQSIRSLGSSMPCGVRG
jgi:hypothetical protein